MTANPVRPRGLALLLVLAAAPLRAEEPELSRLLRDALYTEEVSRDSEGAAKAYQEILQRHDRQRAFAATALFRLAEVRRKQERNEEAVELYQRLIREFPDAATESKLAKENLAALGGEIPPAGTGPGGEEAEELRRLQELAETAPDLLRDPETLKVPVQRGWTTVVEFLLSKGASPTIETYTSAVSGGRIDVCRMLLAHHEPSAEEAGAALAGAIRADRMAVLSFLLSRGIPADSPVGLVDNGRGAEMTPLMVAVDKQNQAAVKLLLEAGADPNRMATPDPNQSGNRWSPGTPLHLAVPRDPEIFKLLVEHGAKPQAEPIYGKTPLHTATLSAGPEVLGQMKQLLEIGADPNAKSLLKAQFAFNPDRRRTPLELAVEVSDPVKVRLLLENGADPKKADRGGKELLKEAASTNGSPELVQTLLEADVPVDEAWAEAGFPGARAEELPRLFRRYVIPELAQRTAISLVMPGVATPWSGSGRTLISRSEHPAGEPPALERLLLADDTFWPIEISNGQERPSDSVVIWRLNDRGELESSSHELSGDKPLPDLQWGDVIEVAADLSSLTTTASGAHQGPSRPQAPRLRGVAYSAEVLWHLRKRVAFPVSVAAGANEREVTLRGDRLVFDPTSDEVPWVGAGKLAELLWQPDEELTKEDLGRVEVVVQREDWPEIRLAWGEEATMKFELWRGDRVTIALPEGAKRIPRSTIVSLRVPSFPFSRHYGAVPSDEFVWVGAGSVPVPPPAPPSVRYRYDPVRVPTLFQAIVDALVTSPLPAGTKDADVLVWAVSLSRSNPPVVLPHPDLSKVHLRRLDDEGNKVVRKIDITAMIAAAHEVDAGELWRQDIPLRAGDIVELPLREDLLHEPWTGLGEAEVEFFARALKARVQVRERGDGVSLREVEFSPASYVESAAGLLPTAPRRGAFTMRGTDVVGNETVITSVVRNGERFDKSMHSDRLFVRDGDRIDVVPAAPAPGLPDRRQPRQRVSSSR